MELPTGTVTFLISDIEGSTRLAANLGPDWPAVLGEHAALIRQAVAAEGGIEVSTEGDSFFCVFVDPEAALRAAVGVVRSMATHGWPEEGRVSVRIGLHTGDGVLGGDNYVGLDVHRERGLQRPATGVRSSSPRRLRLWSRTTCPTASISAGWADTG